MALFRPPPPPVGRISLPLVRTFAFMVQHPETWITPGEMVQRGLMSRATAYRRFDDLVANRALQAKRIGDMRHYRLHPRWSESALGRKLQGRAVSQGLLPLATTENGFQSVRS